MSPRPFVLCTTLALAACSGKKEQAPAGGSATTAGTAAATAAPALPRVAPPPRPLEPLAEVVSGTASKVTWVTSFGGVKVDTARRLVTGADGALYVVGDFEEAASFGAAGDKKSAGKSDAFVARVDANGAFQWVTTLGGKNEERGDAVAVDAQGNVAFTGLFSDTLTAGELTAKAGGSDDLFVAGVDPKGEIQWLWTAGGLASDAATAIAPAGDGGWIVVVSFGGEFDLGGTAVKSKGAEDTALVKLDAGGKVQWMTHLGGEYADDITHVAVDPAGNIFAIGQFRGALELGGATMQAAGDTDVFVARFDSVGNHVWSKRIGNAWAERSGGLAVDPAGHVVITGSFDKDLDFLGTALLSKGESDVFVARLTPDGALMWVKAYGAERRDMGLAVAADKAGNVVVTGGFETTIDLGGGTFKSAGYMDGFVAKLGGADGTHLWSRRFGAKDQDVGLAVAVTADGTPFLAGAYRFTLDLTPQGPTAVQSEGQKLAKPDAFLARFEP